jgi:hypothetical protein
VIDPVIPWPNAECADVRLMMNSSTTKNGEDQIGLIAGRLPICEIFFGIPDKAFITSPFVVDPRVAE